MNDTLKKSGVELPENKEQAIKDVEAKVEAVKDDSKAERKSLLKDMFGELPEKFETFVGDLWESIKQKLGDLKNWFMDFFGIKRDKSAEDEESANTANQRKEGIKKRDEKLDQKTKDDLLKQQQEAEVAQNKDFERLRAMGKIMPGESAELTIWSNVRNEKMQATVRITPDGLPLFVVQDKNGKSVEFVAKELPLGAKIKAIDLTNIGKDGSLVLTAQALGFEKTATVPMSKVWDLIEDMGENKKDNITIHGDNPLVLARIKNELPPVVLEDGGAEMPGVDTENLPDWWEETKKTVMDKAEQLGESVSEFFTTLINLPDRFSRYWNLRNQVGRLDNNLVSIKNTKDDHERTVLVGQNIVMLGKINEDIMNFRDKTPGKKLPAVFGVLRDKLKAQQILVKGFDWSNLLTKGASFLGGNETEENQLLNAYRKTDSLLEQSVDPDEDVMSSLIGTLESVADLFDGDLSKVKLMGKEALKNKLVAENSPIPWFGKLPDAMQDLVVDKMLGFVL